MLSSSHATVRAEIVRLMHYAPPEARQAIMALMVSAKSALSLGHVTSQRPIPLKGWRCLVDVLAAVTSMHSDTDTLLKVSFDLLNIADRLAPADEILHQSANILMHALHADMYVCRMRTSEGLWVTLSADHRDGQAIPIIAPFLDETLRFHPVMNAVLDGHERFVLSNDLHGLERGGGALDCVLYQTGYRSRLAFVLRERQSKPAFGLVQLYTKRNNGFDSFDEIFLSKCARILSLTVSKRVRLARDTLEKAAGAMAHYGNNALNVMRNQAEYCGELLGDVDSGLSRALHLAETLRSTLPEDSPEGQQAAELAHVLRHVKLTEMSDLLGGILGGVSRMARIIRSLKRSVERPRLTHYVLGQEVLQLEDEPTNSD